MNIKLSGIGKWLAGIASAVIASLIFFWITSPDDVQEKTMDISGIWYTTYDSLSYNVIQNGKNYKWVIRETGQNGEGKIQGETLVSYINGEKVEYNAGVWDSHNQPIVLYTLNLNFASVVLFRDCSDYKKFLKKLELEYPGIISFIISSLAAIDDPYCPDI